MTTITIDVWGFILAFFSILMWAAFWGITAKVATQLVDNREIKGKTRQLYYLYIFGGYGLIAVLSAIVLVASMINDGGLQLAKGGMSPLVFSQIMLTMLIVVSIMTTVASYIAGVKRLNQEPKVIENKESKTA